MVRLISTLLLVLPALLHAASLDLRLDKSRVEMGKFLRADITYRGAEIPAAPDLSQWQDDFFIDRNERELTTSADGLVTALFRVRLYPRHRGNIVLEAIALGGAIAPPQHVLVSAAIRNGIDGTPKVRPVEDFYWADQAIPVTIEVPLHDARNNVVADDFELAGFEVTRLPDQRITAKNGTDSILLRWILLSASKGHYSIELPRIQQRGRGRFSFYLPPLSLHIKPLPAYLPPTIPVGQPTLTASLQQDSQRQKILHIDISNAGRLPSELNGFSDWLEQIGIDETAVQTENEFSQGIATRRYILPLPQWHWPTFALFELQYFDPVSGRSKTVSQAPILLWQWPDDMKWPLGALILILLVLLSKILYRLIQRLRHHFQLRRQIRQASDAHQLRHLLLKNSGTKTLQAWCQQYHHAQAQALRRELNRACFTAAKRVDLDALKAQCLKLV